MGFWKEAKRQTRFKIAQSRAQEAAIYGEVMEELERGERDKGLWGKALAESGGDRAKAEGKYIKLRALAIADLLNVASDISDAADASLAEAAKAESDSPKPKRGPEMTPEQREKLLAYELQMGRQKDNAFRVFLFVFVTTILLIFLIAINSSNF